jgi:Ti-type conjugative transfer relaxase TraA
MYSMYIGIIGRSKGSTVDSLAYRAGVKLECSLTGEIFNRESKEVEDVILSLPKEAPDWAVDLKDLIKEDRTKGVQEFCNIVEGAENRKDSQVYREFRLSLPREFTKEQSKELVKEFLDDQVCSHGITALQNYHFDVDSVTGEENPHCHVLLLTRRLMETGLGLKDRSWNTKQQHEQWRSQWASYGNYHLLKNGFEANWDYRSYKDRGINFEPQPKLGSKIIKMEKQAGQDPKNIHSKPVTERGREYQEVKLRNLYTLINRPEEALDAISKQQTTFMWGDVAKLLSRYVDDQALFNRLSLKLQQSSELVCLEDKGSYSRSVFTTRTRLAEEGKFIETLNALKENKSHGVENSVVEGAIQKATESLRESKKDPEAALSQDQIKSIKHMALADQLSFVEGYAGAGKTTVMKVMKEIWEESGYQVFGLAPTGKAAENLADCGIESDTVQRFLKLFENGRSQYDSQTILVLDEAGMVDGRCFGDLIKAVEKLGVKLVASGDLGQLSPVEAGIPFRIAVKEVGKAELTTVLRQKIEWQREATVLFGEGRAAEALKKYNDKGLIKTVDEKYSAINDVANQKIEIEAQLTKVSKTIRARGVSEKNPANVNALFHKLEVIDKQNTFVSDLLHKKDHKGVVELYNLSRRISGNISSEIRKDIEKDKVTIQHASIFRKHVVFP